MVLSALRDPISFLVGTRTTGRTQAKLQMLSILEGRFLDTISMQNSTIQFSVQYFDDVNVDVCLDVIV